MLDVYCFGVIASGVIHRLAGRFPAADGYGEVLETLENHTGEATAGAMVLARFGATVALEGNWIGDNPAGRRTVEFLQSRGIDVSGLCVKPGYRGAFEITFSDSESRTVFGRYSDLLATTVQWEPPTPEKIRAARVVCVDPPFGDTTLAVARIAKSAGKPLVTCDSRADAPLTALADVIAISGEMIAREYPEAARNPEARARLFEIYLERCPGLVVFTAGSRPLWFGRGKRSATGVGRAAPGRRGELPPFRVHVVDSAGAGDSFRAGLIFGLLRGWSDEDSVRFASAVAAFVCTTTPGCVNSPTLSEVRAFLAERGVALPSDGSPASVRAP